MKAYPAWPKFGTAEKSMRVLGFQERFGKPPLMCWAGRRIRCHFPCCMASPHSSIRSFLANRRTARFYCSSKSRSAAPLIWKSQAVLEFNPLPRAVCAHSLRKVLTISIQMHTQDAKVSLKRNFYFYSPLLMKKAVRKIGLIIKHVHVRLCGESSENANSIGISRYCWSNWARNVEVNEFQCFRSYERAALGGCSRCLRLRFELQIFFVENVGLEIGMGGKFFCQWFLYLSI